MAFSGKNALNSPYSWAASVLLGEMIKVGRCRRSMTDATVNVLPDPVTPRRVVWGRLPPTQSASRSMARGWSPLGV